MLKKNVLIIFLSFSVHLILSQENKHIEDSELYFQKGSAFIYTNKDSATYYLNKSIALSEKVNDVEGKISSLTYLVASNGFHYDLEQLKLNLDRMDSILKYNNSFQKLPDKLDYEKNYLIQKGNYNFKIRNFNEAIVDFEQLSNMLTEVPIDSLTIEDRTLLFSTYNFLASIHEKTGKNSIAKDFYRKILSIGDNYEIESSAGRIAGTKMRLASVFENENDFNKANKLLKEALNLYLSLGHNPRTKNNLLSTYQRITKNYLLQDSIPRALAMLKESEQYYRENDAFIRLSDMLYGDIFIASGQYDKAMKFYKNYVLKTKAYRKNKKHQDVAEAYKKIGNLNVSRNKVSEALQYYQKGLMELSQDFNNDDIAKNPDPKKVPTRLVLIKIYKEKLKALQLLYQDSNDIRNLKIAHTTSYSIIETLDLLKPEFESKIDKQFLLSEMHPVFNMMVEVAYDLYNHTKDTTYISDAFHFMEKSKSILLLEAVRSSQASSYRNIPEEIINREQQYRADITHLEKQLFNQKSDKILFDTLFKLRNEYYDFVAGIREQHPRYYNLKYNTKVIELEETKDIIGKNKALLSYFSTEENLFLIAIEHNTISFNKIPFSKEIKSTIISFYDKISELDVKGLPDIYKQGNKLYRILLEKTLHGITSTELIIVPDDVLNYVPFDALSMSDKTPAYLVKEYQVSYSNSVTLLGEQLKKVKKDKNSLIAYAPSFERKEKTTQLERSDLGPLIYNTEEAVTIANYFDGTVVLGGEASLSAFTDNKTNHSILHFATHAMANDEFPDYSYLAFTPEEGNETNNLLYVKDLYAYTINADLITLSACQTGLGKLQKGEGMLSLARGFSYAGSRSLVTTLWKINDQTTAGLMDSFYKNLNKGFSKDKALKNAKTTYLSGVEDDELLQHPYYWSGFILSGDTAPLSTSSFNFWWLLLVVIPVIGFVLSKRKKLV